MSLVPNPQVQAAWQATASCMPVAVAGPMLTLLEHTEAVAGGLRLGCDVRQQGSHMHIISLLQPQLFAPDLQPLPDCPRWATGGGRGGGGGGGGARGGGERRADKGGAARAQNC